jgi:hypothetical protein
MTDPIFPDHMPVRTWLWTRPAQSHDDPLVRVEYVRADHAAPRADYERLAAERDEWKAKAKDARRELRGATNRATSGG